MSTEIETFKTKVEQYIAEHGVSPTRFGIDFARDPRFVFQLRDGREPRTTVRNRIISAIDNKSVTSSGEVAA